jgi:hypothetical protein
MSKENVQKEEYELAEIFSSGQINQKRAKVCSVCGRTIACCLWKSTLSGSVWKYCLDCQDEHFIEWSLEWHNYFLANSICLSPEDRNIMTKQCSKTDFKVPSFPFPLRDCQDHQPIDDDMSDHTPTNPIGGDVSFSPHNDYISSPQREEDIVQSINDEMDCTQEAVVPTG